METFGKQKTVKIDRFKKYATGRDALTDNSYKFAGTYKTKLKEHEIFSREGKFFSIKDCVIEMYQVKKLILSAFNGSVELIEPFEKKEPASPRKIAADEFTG